jgi:hypothetical protein
MVKPFISEFGNTCCADFCLYWLQISTNGDGKLKCEDEKYWDTKSRLRTFSDRDSTGKYKDELDGMIHGPNYKGY